MTYRLRLYPYSGGHDDLIGEGELDVCRKRVARRIRYHRAELEYPVAILERGMKWEMQSGDRAFMIGDREGILVIEPICERCGKKMQDDDDALCEACQEQEDEERAFDEHLDGLDSDEDEEWGDDDES